MSKSRELQEEEMKEILKSCRTKVVPSAVAAGTLFGAGIVSAMAGDPITSVTTLFGGFVASEYGEERFNQCMTRKINKKFR